MALSEPQFLHLCVGCPVILPHSVALMAERGRCVQPEPLLGRSINQIIPFLFYNLLLPTPHPAGLWKWGDLWKALSRAPDSTSPSMLGEAVDNPDDKPTACWQSPRLPAWLSLTPLLEGCLGGGSLATLCFLLARSQAQRRR